MSTYDRIQSETKISVFMVEEFLLRWREKVGHCSGSCGPGSDLALLHEDCPLHPDSLVPQGSVWSSVFSVHVYDANQYIKAALEAAEAEELAAEADGVEKPAEDEGHQILAPGAQRGFRERSYNHQSYCN